MLPCGTAGLTHGGLGFAAVAAALTAADVFCCAYFHSMQTGQTPGKAGGTAMSSRTRRFPIPPAARVQLQSRPARRREVRLARGHQCRLLSRQIAPLARLGERAAATQPGTRPATSLGERGRPEPLLARRARPVHWSGCACSSPRACLRFCACCCTFRCVARRSLRQDSGAMIPAAEAAQASQAAERAAQLAARREADLQRRRAVVERVEA